MFPAPLNAYWLLRGDTEWQVPDPNPTAQLHAKRWFLGLWSPLVPAGTMHVYSALILSLTQVN